MPPTMAGPLFGNESSGGSGPPGTTPERVFNLVLVGDSNLTFGGGTDNYDTLRNFLDSIPVDANGTTPARVVIQYSGNGLYRIRQPIDLNVPGLSITGPTGGPEGANGSYSATLISDSGDTFIRQKTAIVSAPGIELSHIHFAQPLARGSGGQFRNLPGPGFGGPFSPGIVVVASSEQGGFKNAIFILRTTGSPATETITSGGGPLTIWKEPIWPRAWSLFITGSGDFYGVVNGFFEVGSKIVVDTLVNTTNPYEYKASVGGTTAQEPDSGDYPVFTAGQPLALNGFVIPSSGKWNGFFFQETTHVTANMGTEPVTWNGTVGGTSTDGNGNVYTNVGSIWPREVGKTTTDGTITWELTSKTPAYTTGGCTFSAEFQVPVLQITSTCHVHDISVSQASGNGIEVVAGVGGGTDANGVILTDVQIGVCAGHGLFLKGGDVNAGDYASIVVLEVGGAGIYDSSFLGNAHSYHQVDVATRAPYIVDGQNAQSTLYSCYTEGSQPPIEIASRSAFIGGEGNFSGSWQSGGQFYGSTNTPYEVVIEKPFLPWGSNPYTFEPFTLGTGSGASHFDLDPTQIYLRLDDIVRPTTSNGYIYRVNAIAPVVVTSSTNANMHAVAHGLVTGQVVVNSGFATNANANGTFRITVVGPDDYTLDDYVGAGTGGGASAPTTGHLGAVEPVWPTTPFGTVVNGQLTFLRVGVDLVQVQLGRLASQTVPYGDTVIEWFDSLETANFPNGIIRGDEFHSPDYTNFWCMTTTGNPSNSFMLWPGINATDIHNASAVGRCVVPIGFELGRANVAGRLWDYQSNSAYPVTTGHTKGCAFFIGVTNTYGFFGYVLTTTSGGGDTYSLFGKHVACDTSGVPTVELFYAPEQKATGLTGSDATPLPDDDYVRWAHTVTGTVAAQTLDSYTPPDGSVVDIVWDFVIKQTTGAGSPKGAKFRCSIAVRRAGAALTVVDAAVVTPGSANEFAVTVTVDTSSAPAIHLTAAMPTTDTFVSGGFREALGLPSA